MSNRNLKLVIGGKTKRKNYGTKYSRQASAAINYARLLEIKKRLQITGHYPEIRISSVRSVIGEPFNKARNNEGIVTFRFGDPFIVDLTEANLITKKLCRSQPTEIILKRLKRVSKFYMRDRASVRHWVWKD